MADLRTCGLCLKPSVLQDSHLLPAGEYRKLREPSLSNPNPVVMTPEVVMTSSMQIRKKLLCETCEQMFSRLGEKWIVEHSLQADHTFPLLSELLTHQPVFRTEEVDLYEALAPQIDISGLEYFAISVGWRAAATKWPGLQTQIELGPYEEPFRKFLLGGAFPSDVVIQITVASEKTAKLIIVAPMRGRVHGWNCIRFAIPGMHFTIVMARHIPEAIRGSTFSPGAPGPRHFIGVSDTAYARWLDNLSNQSRKTPIKGSLAKRMGQRSF